MKKIGYLLLILAFFLAQPLYGEVIDRIVAVVGDEIITISELNRAFEPYRKNIKENYRGNDPEKALKEARAVLLNRLIDAILIEQEAKKSGINVKDDEVMNAITQIIARRDISMEELNKGLAREGVSFESYKKNIRDQLVRMKLVRREIKSKIIVTDKEIGEYYSSHKQDYEGTESVRIKQILLLFPEGANKETKEKLGKEMEDIHEKLKKGEPFDALAAKYSQGPAASSGGDLGFIGKGMMLPEVEEAAFKLEKGETSGVISSPAGFHIIMVTDKLGAGLKPIAVVREEILAKLEEQKLEKKFEEWLMELRQKTHIEIKL